MSSYQNMGMRLGPSFGRIFIGADYATGKFTDKTLSRSIEYTDAFSRKRMGAFLSLCLDRYCPRDPSIYIPRRAGHLPARANKLRMWLSYNFDVQDKVTSGQGIYSPGEILKGSAFEIGITDKLFYVLSIYMSYRNIKLDKIKRTSGDVEILYGNNKIHEVELGIALPISFFNR